MKAHKLIFFFAVGLVVGSCTKNENSTIVPIGTEYYIEDILKVIPDTAFWNAFGNVEEGPIPPKIEGAYLIAPKLRVKTNVEGLPSEIVEPNAKIRFTAQHNGMAVMELDEATETLTDTVFVMGNGNAFTAYCIEEKHYDVPVGNTSYQVSLRRGVVAVGTVRPDVGIANFRLATIIMDYEDDSHGVLVPYRIGDYFIYKDNDGLVQCIDW